VTEPSGSDPSRRDFLKASTAAAVGATGLGFVPSVHAAGDDTLRIGLIGCGNRGTGAAEQAVKAAPNVKLVAMGDVFPDQLRRSRNLLKQLGGAKVDVPDDRCFLGFNAYRRVIGAGVDLVILATPPGFRPLHLEAAIRAGKHVFAEKPVAVDGPGIRRVLAVAEEARRKGLSVVAGTQRRHQAGYIESMKRIHDGLLGEITAARCSWNQGSLWMKPRETAWSDLEWQLRNWLYFTWLSGDHICEQHVHNLDVVNWALGSHPTRAVGMGGRQVRTGAEYGHIYDHFAVDYEYPGGVHALSLCRQIPNCENSVSEAVVGTKGRWGAVLGGQYTFEGVATPRIRGRGEAPHDQEQVDLIASIRSGRPLNELRTVAESTLTAIMGRMSAYTGQAVTWEQALNSRLDLMPQKLAWGPLTVPPVATPGVTELI
jgi:myo-inositol 2-dehydrogenase / D-chiro-inositol 1-dehydrogenase